MSGPTPAPAAAQVAAPAASPASAPTLNEAKVPVSSATPANITQKNSMSVDGVTVTVDGKPERGDSIYSVAPINEKLAQEFKPEEKQLKEDEIYKVNVNDERMNYYNNKGFTTIRGYFETFKDEINTKDEASVDYVKKCLTDEILQGLNKNFNYMVNSIKEDLKEEFNRKRGEENPGGLLSRIKARGTDEQDAVLADGITKDLLGDNKELQTYLNDVEKVVEEINDSELTKEYGSFKKTMEYVKSLNVAGEFAEIRSASEELDSYTALMEASSQFDSVITKYDVLRKILNSGTNSDHGGSQ